MRCHDVLLAVDESTTIKTPTAKRTKAITTMAPMARYRRILTGSPVTTVSYTHLTLPTTPYV